MILFGGSCYLFIFSSYFQIREIQISGNKEIRTQDLQELVENKINQKLLFYQIKNIFLVNSEDIKKTITDGFPKIAEVNLKRKFPNSLIVEAKEREPIFIWCKDSSPCFYLDKEGIIFEEVSGDSPGLLKIKSPGIEGFKLGSRIIEKETMIILEEIQSKLRDNLRISIKEISISGGKIIVQTEKSWQIYFDLNENPDQEILNLSQVLEKEISPEKRESLEYIDLRFGNRVYYKFRGSGTQSIK